MTKLEWNTWIIDLDLKMKKNKRKNLLIADNCSSHVMKYKPSVINVLFPPKNSTFVSQPLDMSIIRSFKTKFNNYQMSSINNKLTEYTNAYWTYKLPNIKGTMIFKIWEWRDVTPPTIINCWNKAEYDFLDNDTQVQVVNADEIY